MQKKKIYIAGKVTGLDYENVEKKFNYASSLVLDAGCEPINPLKVVNDEHCAWLPAMRKCIIALMSADAVLMLSDTHSSPGAKIEIELALSLKIPIYNGIMDFINQTPWIR